MADEMDVEPTTPRAGTPASAPSTPRSIIRDAEYEKRFELTPRSKLKALLADSDDDDDDETVVRSRARPTKKIHDEDEPVISGGEETLELTAYERVRRSLLIGKAGTEKDMEESKSSTPEKPTLVTVHLNDEDENEDIPINIATRNRQQKTTKKGPFMDDSDEDANEDEVANPSKSTRTAPPAPSVNFPEDEDTPMVGADANSDDDDLPSNLMRNNRFQELVEQKRKERIEKEKEEAKKVKERRERNIVEMGEDDDDSEADDEEFAEAMSRSQARPQRKAGKKAMEEMHRETQRMARSLQLAHEAKTKLKIPKQSLFDRFNFRPANAPQAIKTEPKHTPALSSTTVASGQSVGVEATDEVQSLKPLPTLDSNTQKSPKLDKGKGKTRTESPPTDVKGKGKARAATPPAANKPTFKVPPVKVILPIKPPPLKGDDSDSDLEILDPANEWQKRKNAEQRTKEKSILELKNRAGNTGVPRRKFNGRITAAQLQTNLLRQSREQAKHEREEKIKELQEKGIFIQTAEERLRDELTVEDLIEKARMEAEKVKKQEKKEKKEERLERIRKGEIVEDDDEDSDEEDGEWLEKEQGALYELSGSDEEMGEENLDADDRPDADFSDEEDADEDDLDDNEDGLEQEDKSAPPSPHNRSSATPIPRLSDMPAPYIDDEAESGDDGAGPTHKRNFRRKTRLIDEDDEDEDTEQALLRPVTPKNKNSFAGIGGIVASAPPLGLTQIFAGTMADSQLVDSGTPNLDALRKAPVVEMPNSQAPLEFGDSQDIGKDTQTGMVDLSCSQSQIVVPDSPPQFPQRGDDTSQANSMLPVDLSFSQSQITYDDGAFSATQFPDPTPDAGFDRNSSPAPRRFDDSPVSTRHDPTQILPRKKGRLIRKVANEEDQDSAPEGAPTIKDAFSIMKKAVKKKKATETTTTPFDKSRSEAKGMIYEQAEESDDEYAGLGGQSGDENNDSDDNGSDVLEMIDDDANDIDENAIAAYYAEKERNDDQRNVNRLFKDLQNGGLRRKRAAGADFDLSDSEDEEERRRAVKRRNEARLRKLILEDQNISQIAVNPKRNAFLACIEDREKDDSMMFLDQVEDDLFHPLMSQEAPESQNRSKSASTGTNTPREDSQMSEHNNILDNGGEDNNEEDNPFTDKPPPKIQNSRRGAIRKHIPSIKETLSFLIEDEHDLRIGHPADSSDSDSDLDPTQPFSTSPPPDSETPNPHPKSRKISLISKTSTRRTTTKIIDRVALKRTSTSTVSETTKLAFAAGNPSDSPLFRVPALLRRATTNSSFSSVVSGDSQSSGSGGGTSQDSGVSGFGSTTRKAGVAGPGVSTSINYHAGRGNASLQSRELERERVARQQEARKKKKLLREKEVVRRGGGVAGLLGGGDGRGAVTEKKGGFE